MRKAIFMALDNTLIRTKSGNNYPLNYTDWEFVPLFAKLVKEFVDKGYIPIIVSNQGGIQAGHIDAKLFDEKFDRIIKEFGDQIGTEIMGMYCTKVDKNYYYRKPNPGFAYKAAIALELSLRDSIMVGNTEVDRKFAKNAYIGTYYELEYFLKVNIEV